MTTTTHHRAGRTTVTLDPEHHRPEALLRLTRLGRELRLTDQILSTDLDSVSIVETGPAPAWTTLDGDAVTFAMSLMPSPNTTVNLAVWLGTNAHELGHVLFSPRKDTPLMYRVINARDMGLVGMDRLHNIVEDQRQERLILARFAPWRSHLTAALGHHLTGGTDTSWLLMAGRTWLPDSVRAEARALSVEAWGESATTETTRIIGAYQNLLDPGGVDGDRAWSLLQELHDLYADSMPNLPSSTCTVIAGGEPETGDPDPDAPPTADEAGDPTPGAGAEGDEGEGDSEGDEGDSDGKVDGKGAGASPGAKREALRRAIRDAAKDMIDSDPDTKADLDDVLDALRHGRAGDTAEGDVPVGKWTAATDVARRLHHEVGDALVDLKDATEPGWIKRVDSGRINVRRFYNPLVDVDQLFDRYEPGQMDASELEVVTLLDVSGSMAGKEVRLAEAAYAIEHAVDDIEGRCTTMTWDAGPHRLVKDASRRPDDRMFVSATMGGTVPTSALRSAFHHLADSGARNRMMVVLTDGSWHEAEQGEALIAAMREAGVITVAALLGESAGHNLHGCEHGGRITDLADLPRMFGAVAEARIGAWL